MPLLVLILSCLVLLLHIRLSLLFLTFTSFCRLSSSFLFLEAHSIPREELEGVEAVMAWHTLHWDSSVLQQMKNLKIFVSLPFSSSLVFLLLSLLCSLFCHSRASSSRSTPSLSFASCSSQLRLGAGFDNVDIEAAAQLGIPVCNVPDYGTEEVAGDSFPSLLLPSTCSPSCPPIFPSSHFLSSLALSVDSAMSLLLSLLRKTWSLGLTTSQGQWQTLAAQGSVRLRGKQLGIIGLGRIGKAVALRAKGFLPLPLLLLVPVLVLVIDLILALALLPLSICSCSFSSFFFFFFFFSSSIWNESCVLRSASRTRNRQSSGNFKI
jgi:hypothetical protein